jgi:hypothetical protein
MVGEDPGLVEDEQGRSPVEACLKAMEEIGEDGRNDAGLAHQSLGLETFHVAERKPLLGRVEQAPVGAVQRIGLQRCPQRIGLEQQRQARQGALFDRGGGDGL